MVLRTISSGFTENIISKVLRQSVKPSCDLSSLHWTEAGTADLRLETGDYHDLIIDDKKHSGTAWDFF